MSKALRKSRETMVNAAVGRGTRAGIYIRVSTKREEMISPEVQRAHCEAYCARRGYTVVGEAEEDLGFSGGSSKQRKIGKMIEAVRDGKYDVIVVWQLSRWGRNLLDSLLNVHALQEAGGRLESATEGLDSIETPFGEFSMGQLLLIAQLQRAQIRASWMDAHKHRVDNKLPHSGPSRFGYIYHVKKKDKREEDIDPELLGTYEVDPVNGPILAEMYRAYIGGRSFISIARDLNARGVTGILGGRWTHATVRQTLDTGFGAGLFRYQEMYLPGKHTAVIREHEWTLYVSRRLDNEQIPARTLGQKAKFKRLVWCASCNRRMAYVTLKQKKTSSKGTKVYEYKKWRCAGQGGSGSCKAITCAASVVEDAVRQWLDDGAKFDPGSQTVTQKQEARRAKSATKKLKADVTRIRAAQTKLLDLYLAPSGFSKDQLDAKSRALDEDLREAELHLAEAEADVELAAVPITTAYKALLEAWDAIDPDLFNVALEKVIGKIVIHPDGARPEGRAEIIPRFRSARTSAA